ncbi:MAG: hypothetical protein RMJ67_05210 [Elusimicrobiota bacterium]|nr:hypothetical protein [Endomicrobiia bacterium]MDW8165888.1 hypothetical protein [Elusimicrobiota bacterium]
MKARCLLLFSGGLDSILSFYILSEQKVDIVPLKIKTPFITSKNYFELPCKKKLIFYEAKDDYINLILNPEYGYGSVLNPCIDCKIYMFKIAKEYMEKYSLDFIATGEVVGQRAFSQQKWQLKLIEKKSGLEGLIVRPLCAKLLEPSIPEKNKIVEREKFFAISGKSRKIQIELANKYNIQNPFSAGGCLLTDKNFAEKFKTFIEKFKKWDIEDIELLKIGRHFYYKDTKIILGRNKQENEILASYIKNEKFFVIVPKFNGPTALCYNSESVSKEEIYSYAYQLINNYSKKSTNL